MKRVRNFTESELSQYEKDLIGLLVTKNKLNPTVWTVEDFPDNDLLRVCKCALREQHGEAVKKFLDFTKPVTQCSNIVPSTGSCPRNKLVDFDSSIQDAVEIVRTGLTLECNESGAERVKPLVNARLARGGKTSFLIYLFEELKRGGCAPILISFNGNFLRSPGESQLQALIRLLSVAMTDIDPADSTKYSYGGEEALLAQIANTADGLPVVLLIDELNSLSCGEPLDVEASHFLKRFFLDRQGYYLVFTSHILLELDEVYINRPAIGGGAYMRSPHNSPSPRYFLTVHQPLSTNEQALRAMSDECGALTPAEIAIYGGIPSLIYVSKGRGRVTSPRQRFEAQKIFVKEENQLSVLQQFISESGLLLRCIDAKVNGTRGPFGIVEINAKPDVLCIALPAEWTTLDGTLAAITARMGGLERATIAIVTSAYSKFPDYDGFVVYRSVDGSLRVFGYQCKLNRAYPKRDVADDRVEKSFLLRGNAPFPDNMKRGWEYCGKETIISTVLGHSLAPLYPAQWTQPGATDEFD
eukprot:gene15753-11278_t